MKSQKVSGNCVTEISKSLGIPQPTVSNHVKELLSSGLIIAKRKGKNIFLFGSKTFTNEISKFLEQIS